MDWIRRNWPDLLIGVALVAVIAMIIATLLSGGSLLSLVRRDTPTDQATPQVTTPLGPEGTAADGADPSEADAATSTPDAAGTADTETSEDSLTSDIDPFIPDAGPSQTGGGGPLVADGEAGEDADTADGTDDDAMASSAGDDTGTGPATDATTETDQVDLGAAPAPASEAGRYRVAAGAVGTRAGADDLAQSYRDEGYRVEVEPQGDLFLLWVGPYETETDAESAAEGIRDAGGDALVYAFGGAGQLAESLAEGDSAVPSGTALDDLTDDATDSGDVGAADTGAADEAASDTEVQAGEAEVTVTEAESPEDEIATAPERPVDGAQGAGAQDAGAAAGSAVDSATNGEASPALTLPSVPVDQRYLQVGAFANVTSAEPLRTRLEQLGFSVTSSEAGTGLTRLYVGPFGEAQLSQAQTNLTAQGIDSFPVAQ